ncbi:MAG: hypothetical protein R6W82_06095 [bacterium]
MVLLVLAFSAWSLFRIFIDVLALGGAAPEVRGTQMVGLLVGTGFYAFQVLVFLRRETQDHFGFRGFPLI